MADSWEEEADAPAVPEAAVPYAGDKWEGEDEEEDLPDAWDAVSDSEDKKPDDGSAAATTVQKKRRQNLSELQEKKRREAEERKKKLEEESQTGGSVNARSNLTQKEMELLQEENELLVVMDTFGSKTTIAPVNLEGKSIDNCEPVSCEDFDHLSKLICAKIRKYESSPHFSSFLENTFRECSVEMELDDLRKISTMFSAMVNEKQKMLKAGKGKKKGKSVKVERDPASAAFNDNEYYDDYDDFI